MARVGVIDIGTVSARLGVAEVEGGQVQSMVRSTNVCDLGRGVDATGLLAPEAIARTLEVVEAYVDVLKAKGVSAVSCTLTSAARDASNGAELMDGLAALGLCPEVIPGAVEGVLTFRGAVQFIGDASVLVADSGGGSTELTAGVSGAGGVSVDWVHSFDVGCRRVTERFFPGVEPASAASMEAARRWCREAFQEFLPWNADGAPRPLLDMAGCARPDKLVVTGGTATTLVAMKLELDPYDDGIVQGTRLTRDEVADAAERLGSMDVAARAGIVGVQPRRAPVMLGGAVLLDQLMAATGFDSMTVSVYDGLEGLALAVDGASRGISGPVGWAPTLADLSQKP